MIPTVHRAWHRCAIVALAPMASWQLGCSQPTRPLPSDPPVLGLEQPMPAPGQSALRIANVGDASGIVVPSAAKAGLPLQVTVTTYSGGCISEDTTAVAMHPHSADVVPYQRWYQPKQNEGCTMELRVDRRQVDVVFDQPGIATVRVFGRGAPDGSVVTVSRQVFVE